MDGPQDRRESVSGNEDSPTIDLRGTSMSALVHAIPVIAAQTGRRVIIVGGMAVVCRLSRPYRATSDVDTVNRRGVNEPPQLEILVATGAKPSGPAGVLLRTAAGLVQVDAWAAESATPVLIRAEAMQPISVAIVEPGPLVATKLQALMNRGSVKEGTDLLTEAHPRLRADGALHAPRWFTEHVGRSHRLVRAIPEGRNTQADDLQLVVSCF